jgi:hypothetical protein
MHGCLWKVVGISIFLAEGVSPQDLLRVRMICSGGRKIPGFIIFMGLHASAPPVGQKSKVG